MDWFKKQKLSNWIIGILVVINTVTLVTLWVMRFDGPRAVAPPPEEGPGREQMVMRLLNDELGLSDQQLEALQGMRRRHFKGFREIGRESMALRRRIMDEMFSATPDTAKVREIAESIGRYHASREIQNAQHFQHLWTICTPEQRQKFQSLVHEILPDPMARGRQGRRPKGGRPFERGRRGAGRFGRSRHEQGTEDFTR